MAPMNSGKVTGLITMNSSQPRERFMPLLKNFSNKEEAAINLDSGDYS